MRIAERGIQGYNCEFMNGNNSSRPISSAPAVPLVRLGLLAPVIQELDRLNVDARVLLAPYGLEPEDVANPNIYTAANVVYEFMEHAATEARDRHLGVRVGEQLDVSAWSPLVDSARNATSIVEFLTRFVLATRNDASSVRYTLIVSQSDTSFGSRRVVEPSIAPAQVDGMGVGVFLSLLRRIAGSAWNPKAVLLTLCDPGVLSEDYREIPSVTGDNRGYSIHFPANWLTLPLDPARVVGNGAPQGTGHPPPLEFLEAFREVLASRLEGSELKLDHIARLVGLSRPAVQRRLQAHGTTFSQEVSTLKQRKAKDELARSDLPISAIAASLGYSDPTAFGRAFRSWTGMSPRSFRKSQKSKTDASS